MRRYLLDTWIAGDYVFKRHGVHERVKDEIKKGN
jgi:hypothetical protein